MAKKRQQENKAKDKIPVELSIFKPKRARKLYQLEMLREVAKKYELDVNSIWRDGDCFFSAVEDQLIVRDHAQKFDRTKLRHIVKEHIVSNSDFYKPFVGDGWDKFIKECTTKSIWAEGISPLALSYALGLTVIVINSDDTRPIIFKQPGDKFVLLGYEAGGHYNSLHGQISPNLQTLIDAETVAQLQEPEVDNNKVTLSR